MLFYPNCWAELGLILQLKTFLLCVWFFGAEKAEIRLMVQSMNLVLPVNGIAFKVSVYECAKYQALFIRVSIGPFQEQKKGVAVVEASGDG